MAAGRIVLASVGVHAAVLALVAPWLEPKPVLFVPAPAEQHAPTEVTITEVAIAAPMEVALVTVGDDGPAASEPHHAAIAIATHAGAARGTNATTEVGTHGASTEHGPADSRYMKMRGPELVAREGVMQGIVDRGDNTPPPQVHVTGRLQDRPGGRAVIEDRVTTVTVEKDGTAHLDDEPDIDIHVQFPIRPWAWRNDLKAVGESIADWAADPMAGTRYGRTQDLPRHLQAVEGGCSSFGDRMCDDAQAPGAKEEASRMPKQDGDHVIVPLISGKLDLTSYLAKKFGVGDVYASRKLALLDATRDERAARGGAYRAEQLARSAELMRKNLEALWASTATPDERREVMFELWDECAEGTGPIGEAGTAARGEVLGWIATHHVTYTADELAALNKRRASKAEFALSVSR